MKLSTKLILAFSLTIIVMGFVQALFMQSRIESVFEKYLRENQSGFIVNTKIAAESFYAENGSWKQFDVDLFNQMQRGNRSHLRGMGAGAGKSDIQFVILNNEHIVVADSAGTYIGEKDLKLQGARESLIVNGEKVGELVAIQPNTMKLLGLEKQFIQSANRSIMFATAIAVSLAALAGLIFARRLTAPLSQLMKATDEIGSGDWGRQVSITSGDEIETLGEKFNAMSNKIKLNEEARQALVADVAHELRTPLAILSGQLESIQEGAISADEKVIIQMSDEVYRLSRLVNDLQQLSLAEAGKLPLLFKKCELQTLIEKVISNLSWVADEKDLELMIRSEAVNTIVNADHDRLTQVFVNLIGNAIRHTPEHGRIDINLHETEQIVEIEINDSGPGISSDQLPHIFNRFYRTDSARSRDNGGSGLGLAITKGFIDAHNGTITVQSSPKHGTSFTVTLPKAPDES